MLSHTGKNSKATDCESREDNGQSSTLLSATAVRLGCFMLINIIRIYLHAYGNR